jgi:hypothetical protein
MRRETLARLRESLSKFRQTRLARMVDLLMFQPLRNVEVLVAVDLVHADMATLLQLVQPVADPLNSVVVVRVQTAREESRGCASPSGIVDECPEKHEQKARFPRQLADALAFHELRLDGPDPGHHSP